MLRRIIVAIIRKTQLENIIAVHYGRAWLKRLAGGYGEQIVPSQCDCTEEEFYEYRKRAKLMMEEKFGK